MQVLGIDIGGTGIKGAPVDMNSGELVGERFRVPTPQPALPSAVADVVLEIRNHFDWHDPIGCTFPGIVRRGHVHSAANVGGEIWLGMDVAGMFSEKVGCPVTLINDADAAGLAEMRFGAGVDSLGTVLMLTFGTGIGSGLFVDGRLVPNTEMGHMEFNGMELEHYAAASARDRENLSWTRWGKRVDVVLNHLEFIFSPDLFIIGGGASKKFGKFSSLLTVSAAVKPARFRNNAGIIGAAIATQTESI